MTTVNTCAIMLEQKANIGDLCNGSTADSDSVCLGSSPRSPAKNPTRKSWIFSFVPLGTTSFAVVRFANPEHATSFDRQVNIIAARGTNERGCDKSQMMYFVMMLRLWRKRCCAPRKRNCRRSFRLLIYS